MTKGKLRKALKKKFIELYADLVYQAVKEVKANREKGLYLPLTPTGEKVAELLRKKIGYSCKTYNCDMVHSLLRLAEDLKK